tara:strand:- start:1730 stop:1918 length:189 start_codon:yes stop_codon:yes gene_type:complete
MLFLIIRAIRRPKEVQSAIDLIDGIKETIGEWTDGVPRKLSNEEQAEIQRKFWVLIRELRGI